MLPFAAFRSVRMASQDLDGLRQALLGEPTDVPCGTHPADALAAMIGEQRLSYLSIERVA